MTKIVVYSNGDEAIVTTRKNEPKIIAEFFTAPDRDINDYDREVFKDGFSISPELRIRWAS